MIVEYRLIISLAKKEWILLAKNDSFYTPRENDIVNINGDPFCVYSVGAAMSSSDDEVYVYVEVFKAGTYDLELNGIKY
jgi:hypothetical protein